MTTLTNEIRVMAMIEHKKQLDNLLHGAELKDGFGETAEDKYFKTCLSFASKMAEEYGKNYAKMAGLEFTLLMAEKEKAETQIVMPDGQKAVKDKEPKIILNVNGVD